MKQCRIPHKGETSGTKPCRALLWSTQNEGSKSIGPLMDPNSKTENL
jgi:hypothetical protein